MLSLKFKYLIPHPSTNHNVRLVCAAVRRNKCYSFSRIEFRLLKKKCSAVKQYFHFSCADVMLMTTETSQSVKTEYHNDYEMCAQYGFRNS